MKNHWLFGGAVLALLLGLYGGPQPATASIIVDHQPIPNGPSSDTDYVTSFGDPFWQLLADDFTLAAPASIGHIRWWGLYGNVFGGGSSSIVPPVGDETMRIRFYGARPSDGLPGTMLYEQAFLNPSRVNTGQIADFGTGARRYEFDVDLPIVFEAQAGTRYWMEVAQVGIPSSVFRWSFSNPNVPADAFAGTNPDLSDWIYRTQANLAFQLRDIPEPSSVFPAFLSLLLMRKRR